MPSNKIDLMNDKNIYSQLEKENQQIKEQISSTNLILNKSPTHQTINYDAKYFDDTNKPIYTSPPPPIYQPQNALEEIASRQARGKIIKEILKRNKFFYLYKAQEM